MRTRWTWGFREDTPYTLTRRAEGPDVVFEIDGRSRWRRVGHRCGYFYPTWYWVVMPLTWLGAFRLRGHAFEERVAKAAGQAEGFLARLKAAEDEGRRAHERAKRVARLVEGDGSTTNPPQSPLREGWVRKGGVNGPPVYPRPLPPTAIPGEVEP